MGRSTDAGVAKTGSARKPTTILLPKRDRRVFRLRSLAVLSSALIVLAGATAGGAKAFTPGAGAWYLQYGHCCSGAKLEGTQAKIAGFTQSPESNQCIDYSSGVVAANGDRFIGTGLVKCGSSKSFDNCPTSSEMFLFVDSQVLPNAAQCYNEGNASAGTFYEFGVRESASGSGTWYAYIRGTRTSHYASGFTNNVYLQEVGGHTTDTCQTGGWTAQATWENWQRYNFAAGGWHLIASASSYGGPQGSCWSLGPFNYDPINGTNDFEMGASY